MLYVLMFSLHFLVIYANVTLIIHLINLYYDLAARINIDIQEDVIIPQLRAFFAKFHSFYWNYKDKEETQKIYKAIILNIKKQSIFKKQKLNPTLAFYSFELLSLLRGTLLSSSFHSIETDVPLSVPPIK